MQLNIVKNEMPNNDDRDNIQKEKQASHFKLKPTGIFYCSENQEQWICSPLIVKALVRDQASENWGRLLEFRDADGYAHRWAMPMEMLKGSGEELRGELLRLGLNIAPNHKAKNLLIEYIITSQTEARGQCVNQIGWHNFNFVLPNFTLGQEMVIYQGEFVSKDYKQCGTLEEWQKHIAALCVGNSRLVFAVSCAFASPLLKLMNAESGGVHLVGESSSGKTTALRVAASIYGAPDYLSRWRATTNGLEALAALRSDTLLILDELSQVDPKEAGEIAYMLANGMGKARAGKTGNARSRQEWRILFLSAGEIDLAQHMRDAGKKIKAGQEVRLVNIPADAGQGLGIFENLHQYSSGAEFSKILFENTQRYYGTPLICFLKMLTTALHREPDKLQETMKEMRDALIKEILPDNASGQVHRVCERFAVIAVAGELATSYKITGWQSGEALATTMKCFQAWLDKRGNVGNQERTSILAQVRSFFELHGDGRFSHWDVINPHTANRAGFKKTENGVHHYYVLPEAFRNEICNGFDYRYVTKVLIEEGWLEGSKENTPYRREYLPGLGQSRCYVFTSKMWES